MSTKRKSGLDYAKERIAELEHKNEVARSQIEKDIVFLKRLAWLELSIGWWTRRKYYKAFKLGKYAEK